MAPEKQPAAIVDALRAYRVVEGLLADLQERLAARG